MFRIILKRLREENGLSQSTLASILNKGQSAVGMWESGKSYPDYLTLMELAKFFNVSVSYLTGETTTREKTPSKQQASLDNIDEERLDEELIDALCKLNDEELNQVTSFVQFLLSSPRE